MTRLSKILSIAFVVVVALVVSLLWSPGPKVGSVIDSHSTTNDSMSQPTNAVGTSDSSQYWTGTQSGSEPEQTVGPPSSGRPFGDSSTAISLDRLIIPVQGKTTNDLVDTYTDARSNGRVHDAIDIMAAHNTPVLAAAAGTILRLFQSKLGGTTIYQLSTDSQIVYYYAHLDHYAANLKQGMKVEQGEQIGYVGDTGDAGPGNYHLHFAMWKITDPKNFWNGRNINPYPVLKTLQ